MFVKISESENEVMEVLWEKNDYISVSEVHSILSKTKEWAYRTVATFMLRLLKKGYLKVKKQDHINLYCPSLSKEAYIHEQTQSFLKDIHRGSKKSLIAALYDGKLSNEKIDALLKSLEDE